MKVYVDCVRRITVKPDEGASHRHGANFASTHNHTIATISTPLACLQKAIAANERKSLNQNSNKYENTYFHTMRLCPKQWW